MLRSVGLPRLLVLSALLISLGLSGASCAGGTSGALADSMRETPADAALFDYWNVKAMQDDSDLHPLLERWKTEKEGWLDSFGIATGQVEHFFQFSLYGNNALIVRGRLDREQTRAQLTNRNYNDKDFKRMEVWESPDGRDWLAVANGSLIAGSKDPVKESINVIKGESSLYDDPDARGITDWLPGGLLVRFQRYNLAPYEGLVAGGESFEKKDRDTLRVKLAFMFGEPDQATAAVDDIAEEVDEDYDEVDARYDGRFVIVDAVVDMDDLLRVL